MRMAVCIKQILDPEIPPQNFQVDRVAKKAVQGEATLVTNPFDENAIEVALQMKDRHKESTVTVLTLGEASSEKSLRRALSMGCDEAIHLKDALFEGLDSFGIAKMIAKGISQMGNVDLVLCGRQAGDWDMGQVGCFVAEELSLPSVTMVFGVNYQEGKLIVKREGHKGIEVLEAKPPLVATITSASSNQPRFPTAKGIISATRKKILVWSSQDLQVLERIPRLVTVEELTIPNYGREIKIIDGENGADKGAKLAQHLVDMKLI